MPAALDAPSVFAALLDRAAGTFRFFGLSNAEVPQHRRYVPGTMVLETTWQTPTGWMTVQDFLAVGPVEDAARRPDYRRAPADACAAPWSGSRPASADGSRSW